MKRWLLRLYPNPFRRRYEDELIELLDQSARPVRDALDVAMHAGQLRGEQLMTNAARHLADGVLAFALFTLGYTVNDLQHGVIEVHEHWWSSAAARASWPWSRNRADGRART